VKKLPTIYKYTSKGQIQQWEIIIDGDKYYTIEGIKDGKLTTSTPTVSVGKNIGRSNETTGEEQALKEAQAKWDKKVASGYNEVLTASKNFLEPMLAFEYSKYPIDWDAVSRGEIDVYLQPKLDGVRCINQNNTQTSRNGKPFISTPHLNQNSVCLDGELYTHEYKDKFGEIISSVRKTKPTEEDLEISKKIEYWIYDMPLVEGKYSTRYREMVKWYQTLNSDQRKYFKLTPTEFVHSFDELLECHSKYLSEGFEGTIIRVDTMNYEFKRSKQLLKYKDFIDEEFEIVGYEEGTGNRTGTIGFFILKHDTKDITFKSNVKGNFEYLREVWRDKDSYLGKLATVKYFQRTPEKEDGTGGVPRFPYVIKINREEYE
jgi:DNA ligase-1